MTPVRDIVSAMMLSLRRRYLERQIDTPFDAKVSLELDRAIVEQEQLRERALAECERRRGAVRG